MQPEPVDPHQYLKDIRTDLRYYIEVEHHRVSTLPINASNIGYLGGLDYAIKTIDNAIEFAMRPKVNFGEAIVDPSKWEGGVWKGHPGDNPALDE